MEIRRVVFRLMQQKKNIDNCNEWSTAQNGTINTPQNPHPSPPPALCFQNDNINTQLNHLAALPLAFRCVLHLRVSQCASCANSVMPMTATLPPSSRSHSCSLVYFRSPAITAPASCVRNPRFNLCGRILQ